MAKSQETIMKEIFHKVAEENNIKNYELTLKPVFSGGENYMCNLYEATYNKDDKEEINVFAKIAAISEKMREQSGDMYKSEMLFYKSIAQRYRQIEKQYGIEGEHQLRIPKLYGVHEDTYQETIVLENLISSGYGVHNRFQSIDWEYAAAAMRELAKLHSLSVAYQQLNPKDFEKDASKLTKFTTGAEMQGFWNNMLNKTLESVYPENRTAVQRHIEAGYCDMSTYEVKLGPKKLKVLIHGDYKTGNLMHRIREDGTVEIVTVDFQTLKIGSPVLDFIYFMVSGTDEEFRGKYFDQMVEYYYDQLEAAMRRLNLNPNLYTKVDYLVELKEKLPYSVGFAFFILKVLTVASEDAPVVDDELDLSAFTDKKVSPLFETRLNGLINDYIRWGVMQ